MQTYPYKLNSKYKIQTEQDERLSRILGAAATTANVATAVNGRWQAASTLGMIFALDAATNAFHDSFAVGNAISKD
jgi:hypothetical protein